MTIGTFDTVETLRRALQAAKDIAAPYHYADLHTGRGYLLYLTRVGRQTLGVYAVSLLSGQRLARKLQQNPLVLHQFFFFANLTLIPQFSK